MKKIKLLGARKIESASTSNIEADDQSSLSMGDAGQSISEESVKVKPTKISLQGFTSWVRKIRPTRDGLESEVEKPLIIAKSGHRVTENQIKGQCDICGGYDSYIFNCHIYGCKQSLCLKHVYFFECSEKRTPYCQMHYKEAINEFDTWQKR